MANDIKIEIIKKHPNNEALTTYLKSIYYIANSITLIPDLTKAIKFIATLIGISI